VKARH